MKEKRAQFFLLAAVIISAVIFSMASITNNASVRTSLDSLADFSYDVEEETGAVANYQIFSNVDGDLESFISILSRDIRDRDPDSNFMFIYGNKDSLVIENRGPNIVGIECQGADKNQDGEISDEEIVEGCEDVLTGGGFVIKNNINLEGFSSEVLEDCFEEVECSGWRYEGPFGEDEITIIFEGNEFVFPVTSQNQVIFLVKKDIGGDSYVEVR